MGKEHVIAKTGDLMDGQMKGVEVDGRKVLLLRLDGAYHALGGECPHHGAELADGLLREGHVRCPWHQAVFDGRTGELVEPPSLDALPTFEVRIDGDDVIVILPDEKRPGREPAGAKPTARERFVIVGAGAAGSAAAEALRQAGYAGHVTLLTREDAEPYDRTELSKTYLQKPKASRPMLRSQAFYERLGVELVVGREVSRVDAAGRAVTFTDGSSLTGDKLLIATGSVPRKLGVEGENLAGVFTLRSLADCEAIRAAADGAKKAVVVGASFIGMEAAAALRKREIDVTVVGPEDVPFKRVFGEQIGRLYQQVHEKKGTAFRLGQTVAKFEGEGGKLRAVVLKDGTTLDADLAVVGIGVTPATGIVKGLKLNDDGSIDVDARMQAAEGVYVAGDSARFPDWRTGARVRIEHWRLAQQLGRTAAKNMAGVETGYRGVPFFWTNQYMTIVQYVGSVRDCDEIVVDGDVAGKDFMACYVKDGKVHAVSACNRDRQMAGVAETIVARGLPTVDGIRKGCGC